MLLYWSELKRHSSYSANVALVLAHYSEGLLFQRSAIRVSVRVRVRIAYLRNSGLELLHSGLSRQHWYPIHEVSGQLLDMAVVHQHCLRLLIRAAPCRDAWWNCLLWNFHK